MLTDWPRELCESCLHTGPDGGAVGVREGGREEKEEIGDKDEAATLVIEEKEK